MKLTWMTPALLVFAIGCGNDDGDTDAADATFTEVRDDILLLGCALSSCHGSAAGNLTMSADAPDDVYDALVDMPSSVLTDEILVIPGDAENSYLFKKITGAIGIDGTAMPPTLGIQDEAQVEMIRSWIDAGANND